jgi:hypothetical protein
LIDPSNIVGYSLMGAGSGMVNRVMQHLLPTPFEAAQAEGIYANLVLARERLQIEQRRSEAEWDVRRELLLRQILATRDAEQDRALTQRWPLKLQPAAFLRYSQDRKGEALNVILRQEPRRSSKPYTVEQAKAIWQPFNIAADALIDSIPQFLSNDVIYYRETVPDDHVVLYGQQLEATVYSLTNTEPTALLQVSIASATTLKIAWSCWGWAGAVASPQSGWINVDVTGEGFTLVREIEAALLTVICALNDQFHTARTLANPKTPRLFSLLKIAPTIRFSRDDAGSGEAVSEVAPQLLIRSHSATLNLIARHSPSIAAECATRTAKTATATGNDDLAESFQALSASFMAAAKKLKSAKNRNRHIRYEVEMFPKFGSNKKLRPTDGEDQGFFAGLMDLLPGKSHSHHYEVLSYDTVMPYMTDQRPIKAPNIRGVMMIRGNKLPLTFIQCFVDEHNNTVYDETGKLVGRSLSFEKLDPDLSGLFGDKSVVVIS